MCPFPRKPIWDIYGIGILGPLPKKRNIPRVHFGTSGEIMRSSWEVSAHQTKAKSYDQNVFEYIHLYK